MRNLILLLTAFILMPVSQADAKAKVFILSGQSNMSGGGEVKGDLGLALCIGQPPVDGSASLRDFDQMDFIVFFLSDPPAYGAIMPHSKTRGNPDVARTGLVLDRNITSDGERD